MKMKINICHLTCEKSMISRIFKTRDLSCAAAVKEVVSRTDIPAVTEPSATIVSPKTEVINDEFGIATDDVMSA